MLCDSQREANLSCVARVSHVLPHRPIGFHSGSRVVDRTLVSYIQTGLLQLDFLTTIYLELSVESNKNPRSISFIIEPTTM